MGSSTKSGMEWDASEEAWQMERSCPFVRVLWTRGCTRGVRRFTGKKGSERGRKRRDCERRAMEIAFGVILGGFCVAFEEGGEMVSDRQRES